MSLATDQVFRFRALIVASKRLYRLRLELLLWTRYGISQIGLPHTVADLHLHNRKLESIFELLGSKENDITYSLGWVLANCPGFLNAFIRKIASIPSKGAEYQINLQHFQRDKGITDVEIFNDLIHVVIEAKRGWNLPHSNQLQKYARRMRGSESKKKRLVVMSECSGAYASEHLVKQITNIPVQHFSWKDIHDLSKMASGSNAEKRLLEELRTYLRRLVKMQNQESNMVLVVALADETPEWCRISRQDIVNKKHRYFHPFGRKGWPKEPPNYLAFRYDGRLQSVHHVESSKVVDELHSDIPEIEPGKEPYPYLIYKLGPAIIPAKEVRTGKIYRSGRVRAMLDLLLTCNTISEARNKTNDRLSQIE